MPKSRSGTKKPVVICSTGRSMRILRQHLTRILLGWLLIQFSVIASPVALAAAGMVVADEICTCPGGAAHGAACPMHHREEAASTGASRCTMQNASAPLDVALLSLAGGAGVLPQPISFQAQTVQIAVCIPDVQFFSRVEVPDSPPPRA